MLAALAVLAVQVLLVLLAKPHEACGLQILIHFVEAIHVLDDGVVHKVNVLTAVGKGLVVFLSGKAKVWLRPDVDSQRIPVCHKHPLADVKLVTMNQLRPLDIFLANPLETITLAISEDLVQFPHDLDTAASRLARRLHNPRVATAIDPKLPGLVHLFKDCSSLPNEELSSSTLPGRHWCGKFDFFLFCRLLFLFLLLATLLLLSLLRGLVFSITALGRCLSPLFSFCFLSLLLFLFFVRVIQLWQLRHHCFVIKVHAVRFTIVDRLKHWLCKLQKRAILQSQNEIACGRIPREGNHLHWHLLEAKWHCVIRQTSHVEEEDGVVLTQGGKQIVLVFAVRNLLDDLVVRPQCLEKHQAVFVDVESTHRAIGVATANGSLIWVDTLWRSIHASDPDI
mmetsp:Transcript_12214/g.21677  ORF Transcript_12214/g.21677 Transcript_12214/m.21677 type:complete len:395 (+) Transcript_12214:953-2137(+)